MKTPTGKSHIVGDQSPGPEANQSGRRMFLGTSALLAGSAMVNARSGLAETEERLNSHSPILDKAWAKWERAITTARKQIYGARFYNYSPLTRTQAHLFL